MSAIFEMGKVSSLTLGNPGSRKYEGNRPSIWK